MLLMLEELLHSFSHVLQKQSSLLPCVCQGKNCLPLHKAFHWMEYCPYAFLLMCRCLLAMYGLRSKHCQETQLWCHLDHSLIDQVRAGI